MDENKENGVNRENNIPSSQTNMEGTQNSNVQNTQPVVQPQSVNEPNVGNVTNDIQYVNPQPVQQQPVQQQPMQQQPVQQPVQQQSTQQARVNNQGAGTKQSPYGLNVAALILGIVSLVLWCLWYVSIPCGILAFIFGIVGIKKPGKGMAVSGIVTSAISIVLWILLFVFCFIVGFSYGIGSAIDSSSSYYDLFSDYYDF